MRKTVLKHLLGLGLLLVSQACAAQEVPILAPLDPNGIDTAIAGTMAVASTQTAKAAPLMSTDTPTATLTKTMSPTPYPTFTLVIAVPQVYITKSTNCRLGPSTIYESVIALKAGTVVQAVGRSADAKYWIVRNPRRPSQLCWVWGGYVSVTGVAGMLPVMTPPPTPKPKPTHTKVSPTKTLTPSGPPTATANFAIRYNGKDNCAGTEWWTDLQIINKGQISFQSVFLILADATTKLSLSSASDGFIDKTGCSQDTLGLLSPGTSTIVSLPSFVYDPTGHALNAAVTLCSEPGGNGTCIVQVISFMP